MGQKLDLYSSEITAGTYVVVCYDCSYYPRQALTIDKEDVKVKAMEKSRPAGWKWPVQEIVLWDNNN